MEVTHWSNLQPSATSTNIAGTNENARNTRQTIKNNIKYHNSSSTLAILWECSTKYPLVNISDNISTSWDIIGTPTADNVNKFDMIANSVVSNSSASNKRKNHKKSSSDYDVADLYEEL